MNKILVDGSKYYLDSNVEEITASGNVLILINNLNDNIKIKFNLSDNSHVSVYDFNNKNKETDIEVVHSNNSYFEYNHSFETIEEYKLKYNAIINGNNNINNINISGVSRGNTYMDINSDVNSNTKDNEVNENVKILNLGGKSYISPKLHVSVLNVIANHNTTISNIDEDCVNYLKSKGISDGVARTLISDGYKYGTLKKCDEFYNLIVKE